MHIIKSIEIRNFRGQDRPIAVSLDRYANFLIGRNGTGKTTLINLINSALAVDIVGLRTTVFKSINIKLKKDKSKAVTVVKISRDDSNESESITYKIKTYKSEKDFIVYQRSRTRIKVGGQFVTTRFESGSPMEAGVRIAAQREMNSIFCKSWLSLHRAELESSDHEDEEWERHDEKVSDVDIRLAQAFDRLAGYFYRLDSKIATSLQDFQKRWFLAYLTNAKRTNIATLNKINTAKEKEAVSSIFRSFHVPESDFSDALDAQFESFSNLRENLSTGSLNELSKIAVLIDTVRLHHLADDWLKLQIDQNEISQPKIDFCRVCNKMLYRKYVSIDMNNRIRIENENGQSINQTKLSSGEKQLLIFISETLLQEGKPWIFLADEPELSLHVDWQMKLVQSLLEINPNAQVVFATHSPDIVGGYQDNVIQMEALSE